MYQYDGKYVNAFKNIFDVSHLLNLFEQYKEL
jgi:hypothetical protein